MISELGTYQSAVDQAIAKAQQAQIPARIWMLDYTVWKPQPNEITNRLGWLHSPSEVLVDIKRLQATADKAYAAGYRQAVLLGMGGSSLSPEVFRKTFGVADGHLDLHVLDSTDPGAVAALTAKLDPHTALFIVATKSGGTVETLSFFKHFYNWISENLGAEKAGEHFIAITDPGSRLEKMADKFAFRETYLNNPYIGGRSSALSYFGLIPAALVGVDLPKLLARAGKALHACGPCIPVAENPAARLGLALSELAKAGRDKVTFAISEPIQSFGDWVEQLIAESTGKDDTGILPVVGEPLAAPEFYGNDRVFLHLHLEGDDTYTAALKALHQAGHPVIHITLQDTYDLGTQYFTWVMAIAFAGYGLGIQPFDQPNVESAKIAARAMVAAYTKDGELPAGHQIPIDGQKLVDFLEQSKPGDYISLQAYITPTATAAEKLHILQTKLRDKYKLATTVGFGPRFLHSTGQLHKGDGGNGLFVQIVSKPNQEIPIPDEAGKPGSAITFGVLKQAQALGDAQALIDADRRLISFKTDPDALPAIETLIEAL